MTTWIEIARKGACPGARCPSCNHPSGNCADQNHRGSRECAILARRREMYRAGWTRIKDLTKWRPEHRGDTPWLPRLVMKEFGRRGGGRIFTQTPIKGVQKNYWITTWSLHVVFEQIEALAAANPGRDYTGQEAKDFIDNTVGVLMLTRDHLESIPDEWRRPDGIAPWLEIPVMTTGRFNGGVPVHPRDADILRAAWNQEWFRAGEALPEWSDKASKGPYPNQDR